MRFFTFNLLNAINRIGTNVRNCNVITLDCSQLPRTHLLNKPALNICIENEPTVDHIPYSIYHTIQIAYHQIYIIVIIWNFCNNQQIKKPILTRRRRHLQIWQPWKCDPDTNIMGTQMIPIKKWCSIIWIWMFWMDQCKYKSTSLLTNNRQILLHLLLFIYMFWVKWYYFKHWLAADKSHNIIEDKSACR